jgi:hypothetical protein
VKFPFDLLAWNPPLFRAPRPGRLACPSEPSGPLYNSPIRRRPRCTIQPFAAGSPTTATSIGHSCVRRFAGSTPMSFGKPAASTSGWCTRPRDRGIGSTGCTGRRRGSSFTGLYAMATAGHREPCDSRGSCTVLGAPGGETQCFQCDHSVCSRVASDRPSSDENAISQKTRGFPVRPNLKLAVKDAGAAVESRRVVCRCGIVAGLLKEN